MARQLNRLSALRVNQLKEPGRYPDGGNLWLQIAEGGSKSWVFRYRRAGKARYLGLGPLHTVSLADARAAALEARKLLLAGKDPIDEKRARLATATAARATKMTFKAAAEKYIAANQSGWKNAKHAAQWPQTLTTYAYPHLGHVPVDEIETKHVLAAIEPLWQVKVETASRTRGRIEKVLDWCTARGLRSGPNPAAWSNHLALILPPRAKVAKVTHRPAMPYADVPGFMAELRTNSSLSARALEFLVLTATRSGETLNATWAEIDLDYKLRDETGAWRPVPCWIIPAQRMKAGREHRVPLCSRAIEILRTLPRIDGNPHIFAGARSGKPLSNMALLQLMRGIESASSFVPHGFRSSFRDWCGEVTHHPREVAEHALAHQLADKAEAAYSRSSLLLKRQRLMNDWDQFCSGKSGANVVPFNRADSPEKISAVV